jgi:multiple sugar transport system ATP-binding protein
MTMGDRVRVLKDVLQRVDTPLHLYERPGNVFVAGFIGSPAMNIDTFAVVQGHVGVAGTDLALPRASLDAVAAEASTRWSSASDRSRWRWSATVRVCG